MLQQKMPSSIIDSSHTWAFEWIEGKISSIVQKLSKRHSRVRRKYSSKNGRTLRNWMNQYENNPGLANGLEQKPEKKQLIKPTLIQNIRSLWLKCSNDIKRGIAKGQFNRSNSTWTIQSTESQVNGRTFFYFVLNFDKSRKESRGLAKRNITVKSYKTIHNRSQATSCLHGTMQRYADFWVDHRTLTSRRKHQKEAKHEAFHVHSRSQTVEAQRPKFRKCRDRVFGDMHPRKRISG